MIIPTSRNDYAAGFADGYRQGKKDTEQNEQIKWERDVAVEQLRQLGYGLGEAIRTEKDCISRKAVIKLIRESADDFSKLVYGMVDPYDLAFKVGHLPSAEPDFSCDGCQTPKHICGICMRNYPNITDHYCRGEWAEDEEEHTMEEFMYGQDMGSEEDGSL